MLLGSVRQELAAAASPFHGYRCQCTSIDRARRRLNRQTLE
jgi:hypothetical protein